MVAPTRVLLCALALAVAACAPPAEEPTQEEMEAEIAAVAAVRDMEVAAVNAGTGDVSYVAADVMMMPPNQPALVGSTAVSEWFRGFLSQVTATLTYTESDITVSGDWAIERYSGTMTLTPVGGGDAMEETVKGLHVYRRGEDGAWKMVYDVWNSDAPPPAMDAPPTEM